MIYPRAETFPSFFKDNNPNPNLRFQSTGFVTTVCVLFVFLISSFRLFLFYGFGLHMRVWGHKISWISWKCCELPCGCWLGIKPRSFERATRALNHRTTSPAYCALLLNQTNDILKQVICDPIHHRGREQLFKISLQKWPQRSSSCGAAILKLQQTACERPTEMGRPRWLPTFLLHC